MIDFTALRRSLADLLDPSRLSELLDARAERDEAVETAVREAGYRLAAEHRLERMRKRFDDMRAERDDAVLATRQARQDFGQLVREWPVLREDWSNDEGER